VNCKVGVPSRKKLVKEKEYPSCADCDINNMLVCGGCAIKTLSTRVAKLEQNVGLATCPLIFQLDITVINSPA
jgi:hypothetical protein